MLTNIYFIDDSILKDVEQIVDECFNYLEFERAQRIDDNVAIVISNDTTSYKKCDIEAVAPLWPISCVIGKKLMAKELYVSSLNKFLSGLHISLMGFCLEEYNILVPLISHYGGQHSCNEITSLTNIVISHNDEVDKLYECIMSPNVKNIYQYYLKISTRTNTKTIIYLTKDWLINCFQMKRYCSPTNADACKKKCSSICFIEDSNESINMNQFKVQHSSYLQHQSLLKKIYITYKTVEYTPQALLLKYLQQRQQRQQNKVLTAGHSKVCPPSPSLSPSLSPVHNAVFPNPHSSQSSPPNGREKKDVMHVSNSPMRMLFQNSFVLMSSFFSYDCISTISCILSTKGACILNTCEKFIKQFFDSQDHPLTPGQGLGGGGGEGRWGHYLTLCGGGGGGGGGDAASRSHGSVGGERGTDTVHTVHANANANMLPKKWLSQTLLIAELYKFILAYIIAGSGADTKDGSDNDIDREDNAPVVLYVVCNSTRCPLYSHIAILPPQQQGSCGTRVCSVSIVSLYYLTSCIDCDWIIPITPFILPPQSSPELVDTSMQSAIMVIRGGTGGTVDNDDVALVKGTSDAERDPDEVIVASIISSIWKLFSVLYRPMYISQPTADDDTDILFDCVISYEGFRCITECIDMKRVSSEYDEGSYIIADELLNDAKYDKKRIMKYCRQEVIHAIERSGACCVGPLCSLVTHLVCHDDGSDKNDFGEKYHAAMKYNKEIEQSSSNSLAKPIHVVNVMWLLDSLRSGKKCDETLYRVGDVEGRASDTNTTTKCGDGAGALHVSARDESKELIEVMSNDEMHRSGSVEMYMEVVENGDCGYDAVDKKRKIEDLSDEPVPTRHTTPLWHHDATPTNCISGSENYSSSTELFRQLTDDLKNPEVVDICECSPTQLDTDDDIQEYAQNDQPFECAVSHLESACSMSVMHVVSGSEVDMDMSVKHSPQSLTDYVTDSNSKLEHTKTSVDGELLAHSGAMVEKPSAHWDSTLPKDAAYVFQISGSTSIVLKLTQIIYNLNGRVIDSKSYDPSCSHIICSNTKRTEKFLCGCASGKWILKPSYIEECELANSFVDEKSFQWFPSPSQLLLTNAPLQSTSATTTYDNSSYIRGQDTIDLREPTPLCYSVKVKASQTRIFSRVLFVIFTQDCLQVPKETLQRIFLAGNGIVLEIDISRDSEIENVYKYRVYTKESNTEDEEKIKEGDNGEETISHCIDAIWNRTKGMDKKIDQQSLGHAYQHVFCVTSSSKPWEIYVNWLQLHYTSSKIQREEVIQKVCQAHNVVSEFVDRNHIIDWLLVQVQGYDCGEVSSVKVVSPSFILDVLTQTKLDSIDKYYPT